MQSVVVSFDFECAEEKKKKKKEKNCQKWKTLKKYVVSGKKKTPVVMQINEIFVYIILSRVQRYRKKKNTWKVRVVSCMLCHHCKNKLEQYSAVLH